MAKTSMINKQQRPQKFSTREYTRCRICGRVWDIEGVPVPRSLPEGFSWEECELEVSGVCAACTAKR